MRHLITTIALLTLACGTTPPTPLINGAAPHAPPPVAERYIATIAVDDYKHARPLYGAVHDADAITTAFRDRLSFRDTIDGIPLSLHDNAATRDGIEAFTHRANGPLAQLPDDALLVLYVALHGQSAECGDHACGEVLPQDRAPGQGYDVQTLLARLDHLPVRHVLLLLDTCDSGMALGGPVLYPVSYAALRDPATGRKSRKVITAAAVRQDADDGDEDRRGRFAAALLDGLAGEADLFPDGNLLYVELAIYLQTEVATRSDRRQQPEYGGFLSDGRGSPSLGRLDLPFRQDTSTREALIDTARHHLDVGDIHLAHNVLARYLRTRSNQQAWAARRALNEAHGLAGDGQHIQAIARLDHYTRAQPTLNPASKTVLAQYVARLARSSWSSQVLHREANAIRAARDLGEILQPRGQGLLLSALGAMAMCIGANEMAVQAATAAGPLVDPELRRIVADNAKPILPTPVFFPEESDPAQPASGQ